MKERDAIVATFDATADIYERKAVVKDYRSVFEDSLLYAGVPCALSKPKKSLNSRNQSVKQELFAELIYDAELFLSAELSVRAGCRVVVTQCGKETDFVTCGEPFLYPSHQEILVRREEKA